MATRVFESNSNIKQGKTTNQSLLKGQGKKDHERGWDHEHESWTSNISTTGANYKVEQWARKFIDQNFNIDAH